MNTSRMMGIGAWVFLMAAMAGWAQSKGWDRRFGGSMDENCYAVVPAPDAGFLLFGSSASGPDGDHTESLRGQDDFWCVKINSFGDKQWDKRFGGSGRDLGGAACATRDGGYLLGGSSGSGADGDKTQGSRGGMDMWIVKIDSAGNKQWDRRFGGTNDEELVAVQQTRDGGYFLAGSSWSGSGGSRSKDLRAGAKYWVVKTDASGNQLWDKSFGGSGTDYCTDAKPTSDGGYILGGYSDSEVGGDVTQSSRGERDYWIVKINATGRKQWDRRFGGGGSDMLMSLVQTRDGGYVLGGSSNSEVGGDRTVARRPSPDDFWIVKVSSTGAKQWDASFGGSGGDEIGDILQNPNGSYLLAGYSSSPIGGDLTQASRGSSDFWAVQLSAAGTKQWVRRFGGDSDDICQAVCRTLDGSYLLAGSTLSGAGFDKTEDSRGVWDFWAVRVVAPDAFEADNAIAAARPIPNGQVQHRNIHQTANDDWTKFTINAGGARDLQIVSTYDTQIWLFRNRDSALMGYDAPDHVGDASTLQLATLDPGTYSIVVSENGSDGILPYYQFTARWRQVVLRDAYENDNRRSAAKRIRNGRTQNHTIHRIGDRDWAKFTIGSAGAVNLKVETRGASGDTQMWLYDSAGRRLKFDDDSGPVRFSRIRKSSLPAGTYYIKVQENGNNERIEAYTLRATWTAR